MGSGCYFNATITSNPGNQYCMMLSNHNGLQLPLYPMMNVSSAFQPNQVSDWTLSFLDSTALMRYWMPAPPT